jgi:hypothetical protein
MSRRSAIASWFSEAANLRKFALWNIWFWLANQPILTAWYFVDRASFTSGAGILYVAELSVGALWLSSLAWWQSTRVEERQIETEEASSDT